MRKGVPEFAQRSKIMIVSRTEITEQPANLRDLHEVLAEVGTDLLGELRTRIKTWDLDEPTLVRRVFLIVWFPKTRQAKGSVEATDVWTFLTSCTLLELEKEIGLWDLSGQKRGQLLMTDETRPWRGGRDHASSFTLFILPTTSGDSNGQKNRFDKKIVGVGVGALGSQVVLNLIRSAHGEWTLIDDDLLLPHNLARHALDGVAQGYPKAHTLACFANSLIDGTPIAQSILADVLEPGEAKQGVEASLTAADIILDMSASVTVARHLVLNQA